MNFYREWKRFFLRIEFGRVVAPSGFHQESLIGTAQEPLLAKAFVERYYAEHGHPYQDPAALAGDYHVGAQTATVTVEPLNMVNQQDEE